MSIIMQQSVPEEHRQSLSYTDQHHDHRFARQHVTRSTPSDTIGGR